MTTLAGAPECWVLVPARGGSKSILKKNIVPLGGRPMMAWGIAAAKSVGCCTRIVCSTDDDEIATVALNYGIEVDRRPAVLATDSAAVADVAREFLGRQVVLPEILILVQPTSPFLQPEHLSSLVERMLARPECNSGQTITEVGHNCHAWNQRTYEAGEVHFKFAAERKIAYNKQSKPKLFTFGNLVAVRPRVLMEGLDFFAEPSVGVEIEWPYNLDVDGPTDLRIAELLLQAGIVG